MPLYEFICPKCSFKEEQIVPNRDSKVGCDECGAQMERQYPTKFAGPLWPENGITMDNVGPQPVHFPSRSDAKRWAKEHNQELGCL
jgi:putative FmdB family regulatory protein